MSIIIFGDSFTFPEGNAPTNRVFTYAKGFHENGTNVHVVCLYNEYLEKSNGIINAINFYHPFGQKQRHKYFLVRRFQKLLKYFRAITLIRTIDKEDKIASIIVYSASHLNYLCAWFLARVCKTKLIIECSEHPMRFHNRNMFERILGTVKFYIESYLSDGVFCISQYLIDFHKERKINSRKLYLVPSTVDPSRFSTNEERPRDFQYIGYFGSLTFTRDNVDLLIKAFAQISKIHPAMHLVLGGFCSAEEKQHIKQLVAYLNIDSRVELLGYAKREEIIRFITHAKILVMVRVNDLKSKASFPSKLTEYLTTSNPVVTVDVGDISQYLKDSVNAFVVNPGNSNELANKLDYILNNYEVAQKVALVGKNLTSTIFNYIYQAKRMKDFIDLLHRNGHRYASLNAALENHHTRGKTAGVMKPADDYSFENAEEAKKPA